VNPQLGLGAASGCTVLELDGGQVSITGPAGGILGDVCIASGGKLSMSGDEYVTGQINLGSGVTFQNSSHGTVNVVSNVDLSAQIVAAYAAAMHLAALPCTQSYARLDGSIPTITGGVGTNVICVTDVTLAGKQITITGPPGAKFVFNVSGKFTLSGGGMGPQIRTTGGVSPNDVVYNILGSATSPGPDIAFSGGGGGVNCCVAIVDGTILAPYRKINLSPGLVNGQIISGKDISIVSGSSVRCPPCPPTNSVAPAIQTQPESQTVQPGASVMFSVAAAGTAPLAYQWLFNATNVAGATGPSLKMDNVDPQAAGTYSVLVSNEVGVAVSAGAALAINTPSVPKLTLLTSNGSLVFSWSAGSLGYELQSANDLNGAWSTVTNTPQLVGDRYVLTVTPTTAAQQFFRLRKL